MEWFLNKTAQGEAQQTEDFFAGIFRSKSWFGTVSMIVNDIDLLLMVKFTWSKRIYNQDDKTLAFVKLSKAVREII